MKTKLVSGAKSTEFWIVAAFVADLFAQRFGLYSAFSADQVADVASQVKEIADQLRGETGSDSSLVYMLGAIYVAGRTLLKAVEK